MKFSSASQTTRNKNFPFPNYRNNYFSGKSLMQPKGRPHPSPPQMLCLHLGRVGVGHQVGAIHELPCNMIMAILSPFVLFRFVPRFKSPSIHLHMKHFQSLFVPLLFLRFKSCFRQPESGIVCIISNFSYSAEPAAFGASEGAGLVPAQIFHRENNCFYSLGTGNCTRWRNPTAQRYPVDMGPQEELPFSRKNNRSSSFGYGKFQSGK